MDLDLREAFDQGFGPEPAHRPVSERVEAGHRAVRRRRLVGTVLTVAFAIVVGVGAVAVLGDGPEGPTQVATDPTTEPTTEPTTSPSPTGRAWVDNELARYSDDGEIELRDGVTVLQRIDSPLPAAEAQRSVALALERDGLETWWLLQWDGPGGGGSWSSWHPGGAFATLQRWVDEQVLLATHPEQVGKADYVTFADDGSLVSSQGVQILEQRHPIELKNFTEKPSDRTAAALLQRPDGTKLYVLVRDLYGEVDVQTWGYASGGPDLDAFLAVAKAAFESGEGGR